MSDIELTAIDRQARRFSWLSIGTMIVSFVHMVAALSLFSDGSLLGNLAAVLMTGLVDGATWVVTGYMDYARRRNLKRNTMVAGLLWGALLISFGLNLAYLLAHMPPRDVVPRPVSVMIAIVFSVFIPACIGVASLARGELEDDKTQHLQAAGATDLVAQPVNVAGLRADDERLATKVISVSRPPATMLARTRKQLAAPVTLDATGRVDDWIARNDAGETYTAISASLGGKPSRQYIADQCKQRRNQLAAMAKVSATHE